MIQVRTVQTDGRCAGFLCTGHANSVSDDSFDPVCGAVSLFVINTANALEMYGAAKVLINAPRPGFLQVQIREPNDRTELLIDTMRLGIRSVIDAYGSDYVSLTESRS